MQLKIILEIGPKTRAILSELASAVRAMDNRLTATLMSLPVATKKVKIDGEKPKENKE